MCVDFNKCSFRFGCGGKIARQLRAKRLRLVKNAVKELIWWDSYCNCYQSFSYGICVIYVCIYVIYVYLCYLFLCLYLTVINLSIMYLCYLCLCLCFYFIFIYVVVGIYVVYDYVSFLLCYLFILFYLYYFLLFFISSFFFQSTVSTVSIYLYFRIETLIFTGVKMELVTFLATKCTPERGPFRNRKREPF